ELPTGAVSHPTVRTHLVDLLSELDDAAHRASKVFANRVADGGRGVDRRHRLPDELARGVLHDLLRRAEPTDGVVGLEREAERVEAAVATAAREHRALFDERTFIAHHHGRLLQRVGWRRRDVFAAVA